MNSRRFVLDTNIIISAFLFENGKAGRTLDIAEEQGRLLISVETVSELSEVLEREKFDDYVSKEIRRELFIGLLEEAELIEVHEHVQVCRDPDDDKFIELAVEAEAKCIVSGDQDLLVLGSVKDIPILSIDGFLKQYEE